MNRTTLALVIVALIGGLVGGMLLAGQQGVAFAQDNDKDKEKPVDVQALLAPTPVVAAVPYQSKTDYEQDPFEPTKLRRTTTSILRVMLVHQDGTLEIKEAP